MLWGDSENYFSNGFAVLCFNVVAESHNYYEYLRSIQLLFTHLPVENKEWHGQRVRTENCHSSNSLFRNSMSDACKPANLELILN